jgi:hypothetical protein
MDVMITVYHNKIILVSFVWIKRVLEVDKIVVVKKYVLNVEKELRIIFVTFVKEKC